MRKLFFKHRILCFIWKETTSYPTTSTDSKQCITYKNVLHTVKVHLWWAPALILSLLHVLVRLWRGNRAVTTRSISSALLKEWDMLPGGRMLPLPTVSSSYMLCRIADTVQERSVQRADRYDSSQSLQKAWNSHFKRINVSVNNREF